ncbi:imidazole glycerol phosphate synthase subunit HisH [Marinilactibacillus psychrotolerans]|uniref:Imidazole glycerol phosphate synthase subunit HisH n=2 Tax=Marinilactibacillus psychrotolerans TaxID=191770 RepID=A0A5R9C1N5_9LACT|nr:imidazole glycerol phosphate synthase subunit HisH [Marinilactibacillus psychrotolerans]TLQ06576.1 imidazole glycerol phosphate synthase subunit HisH [Marinilactibacillus psychrotolerans]GEQ33213.1 imidazole glycerol phosphate synthase, glutamine amidotransferase subunit [Marinilactibacillus psychrotolerans]SJN24887.1 Imidazole glycerol phosphate synthase amidotransferase subunit [Marinilactibacillus psychrotolerans 42ea]
MIAIVDYGLGNIANLTNALEYLGYEVNITNKQDELEKADKIILPGVGHYKDAMNKIEELNLLPVLEKLKDTKPFIGICLGMQLLFEHSEEGNVKGLGYLPGTVKKITGNVAVPHLGWNKLNSTIPSLDDDVYFIHSFKVHTDQNVVATAEYDEDVVAIVQKESIVGIQFHPEKSGTKGLQILDQALKGGFTHD